jgi:hypothetical protein
MMGKKVSKVDKKMNEPRYYLGDMMVKDGYNYKIVAIVWEVVASRHQYGVSMGENASFLETSNKAYKDYFAHEKNTQFKVIDWVEGLEDDENLRWLGESEIAITQPSPIRALKEMERIIKEQIGL